ncbi:MAG TPA: TonB-dependent receptor plug domain-containing protein, partial [Gemmatimonadaceae bacterium]|nr:TonB-dependent receptor plug domain-containing protein [Gemmatimonadaceae bacterium]
MHRLVRSLVRRAIPALVAATIGATTLASLAQAQTPLTRRVTGVVTQVGGQPIPFASITAVGIATSARVDERGHFAITLPAGAATLVVRAISFAPQQLRVAESDSEVRIVLEPRPITLGEITIAGDRSSVARRTATTAGAELTAEQVTVAPAQSIEQALQGKVLGASINLNTGAPGGGGQIQIRGTSSILGSGEPLIVIDGIISSNDAYSAGASTVTRGGASQDQNVNRLADLNPSEIESIEIVKDASATAIYGSRASNGVVVIRTKRGQAGAPRVTVSQRVGVAAPLRYLGQRTYSEVSEVLGLRYGATTNAAATAYLNTRFPDGSIPASANVDLEREFFDNRRPAYETAVTASGGSDATRYYTSATHRREEGLAKNTGATLQSLRVNLDHNWGSRLTASVGLGAIRNVLDRGLANNDNSFTSPVYAFAYTPAVFDLRERDAAGNYVRNPIFGGGLSAS